MPRLDKLEDVIFAVEEHPVFVSIADPSGERRLSVPDKKAIVARNNHRVLGIVGQGYQLVSNREELDMAHQCCRTVFPETKPGEWEVIAADAPATASYCHIDLRHNSTALDFNFMPPNQRPEVFGPFIRVTNSYNGLRALAFDVGFYRKICKNGLIIPDTIIRFSFAHDRRGMREGISFEVEHKRLTKFKATFNEYLGALRDFAVSRADFERLVLRVLCLRQPEPLKPDSRQAEDWQKLTAHLGEMSDRYAGDLGENAYAVFNAVTEFASHPPANRCVHRDRHSLQRLAGAWVNAFSQECRKPGFTVAGHLAELAKLATETEKQRMPERN